MRSPSDGRMSYLMGDELTELLQHMRVSAKKVVFTRINLDLALAHENLKGLLFLELPLVILTNGL